RQGLPELARLRRELYIRSSPRARRSEAADGGFRRLDWWRPPPGDEILSADRDIRGPERAADRGVSPQDVSVARRAHGFQSLLRADGDTRHAAESRARAAQHH